MTSDLQIPPAAARTGPRTPVAIAARGLTKTFGAGPSAVPALGPVDLSVHEGEFVCLVGPSGCGKSTIVKIIAGLLEPTGGQLDVHLTGDSRAPIATVFQDYGIFPWKTVSGNVQFALRTMGMSRPEARDRSGEWLARMGLSDFADAYPSTLSGGMRQRVAIARAMATEPEVLLMDEPFAALDAQMREMLQEVLLNVSQDGLRTVMFVTHSLEEAIVLGDRVVVMSARPGRIIDDVPIPFERPRGTQIRGSAQFGEIRAQLWDNLRREVEQQISDQKEAAR